ncbi:unnamed protein product [Ectocarpus sp. CCAP 1310/34]|nr:unnamed protein product [Ectocarpus sp. CCAP 1310/34]
MGAFIRKSRQQQQEQEEEESSSASGEVGPAEKSAAVFEVESHTSSPGGGGVLELLRRSSNGSIGSIGNMSIAAGHGLSIDEWCSRGGHGGGRDTSGKGRRGGKGVGGFTGMPNLLHEESEKGIQEVEEKRAMAQGGEEKEADNTAS